MPALDFRRYTVRIFSTNNAMKTGMRPPSRSTRFLDQVWERIRYCHYSLRTEQTYVYWAAGS